MSVQVEEAHDARRESAHGKPRWALICYGMVLPNWQADCVLHLLGCGESELALIIVAAESGVDRHSQPGPRTTLSEAFYRLYDKLWVRRHVRALRRIDLTPQLGKYPSIIWVAGKDSADAIAAIQDHRIDFILQCASTTLARSILNTTRLGVWTFQSPDEDDHGGLGVFWQLYRGEAVYSWALRKLSDRGSRVLQSGCFTTKGGAARTIDAALRDGTEWCARTCRQMALGEPVGREETAAPPLRVPSNKDFLFFLVRRGTALARDGFRRFFLLDYWNIGIVDAPIERLIATERPTTVRWLPSPQRFYYHADPFVVGEKPNAVLFEEYSHAVGKGWISWISLSQERAVPHRIYAFDGGAHRSYPYLFSAEGSIFCVPECAERHGVELYRAVSFPHDWQRVATLIDDFPALDSTLFSHDGRWWLFCTSAAAGGEHKLYAWHAQSLLGPWQPHAFNPIKCDVSSARPAGRPFSVDGHLCRPAQDCSRTYGGAITINRVVTLTPTAFEEIVVGRIEPARDGKYTDGLHTVCAAGDMTIIDGKRVVFSARAAYLKRKARRTAQQRAAGPAARAAIGPEQESR